MLHLCADSESCWQIAQRIYDNLAPSRAGLKKAEEAEVPTGAAKFTYKVENSGKVEMGGFDLGLPSTDIAKVLCSSLR